jgi:hypothetical protein
MKNLIVVLAVAFSGVLNAQTQVISTTAVNQINNMYDELNFRRELGGYVLDKNEKFVPVLKKLIEGRLNIDSLESKQRQLYRIGVNEDFKGGKHISVLTYFHKFDVEKFKDTSKYEIVYLQSELGAGRRNETVSIYNKETSECVLVLHLQFETYSNLIYDLFVK